MRRSLSILWVGALVGAFGVACADFAEPTLIQPEQQIVAGENETGTVVSEAAAVGVAENFFNNQGGDGKLATRGALGALKSPVSVKAIKADAGDAAMHVINYDGGGWAIISATRDYIPVLAYSDEGSFEVTDDMGPVDVWLSETKEAIRVAANLDAEAKASIRAEWNRLEPADYDVLLSSARKTRAAYDPLAAAAFDARYTQLWSQYGSQGYIIIPLDGADSFFDNQSDLQLIRALADGYNSPHEYTIVGVKRETISSAIGPLVTTHWHQDEPYNYDCGGGGYPVGCIPIALGQIMKFFGYPSKVSSMPDRQGTNTQTALTLFLKEIGEECGINYPTYSAGATYREAKRAFESYGYNTTLSDHNTATPANWIRTERKPFFMSGRDSADVGHAWVCDGLYSSTSRTNYFVEFLDPWAYTYWDRNRWPASNPGRSDLETIGMLHMNWGQDQYDGWFHPANSANMAPGDNYQYERKNIYVKR